MIVRSGFFGVVVALAMVVGSSSAVGAGANAAGGNRIDPRQGPRLAKEVPSGQDRPQEHYGVPLAPPIYFVNFLLVYIANPNIAANMPAYRAPLPVPVVDCLESNSEGCPYDQIALSFDGSTKGNRGCTWPPECRTTPQFEKLAPPIATRSDQINQPLGMERASELAELLGVDNKMILTDREYQCTIGLPPRGEDRQIIFACMNNLTNSKGNTNIPLSSYGLGITDDPSADVPVGYVQSLCAPSAPCLVFNELFDGPLERIAAACGWEEKLARLLAETQFVEFGVEGANCQALGGTGDDGPCIVQPVCGGAGY